MSSENLNDNLSESLDSNSSSGNSYNNLSESLDSNSSSDNSSDSQRSIKDLDDNSLCKFCDRYIDDHTFHLLDCPLNNRCHYCYKVIKQNNTGHDDSCWMAEIMNSNQYNLQYSLSRRTKFK